MNVSLGKNLLLEDDEAALSTTEVSHNSSASPPLPPNENTPSSSNSDGREHRLGNILDLSQTTSSTMDATHPDVPRFKNFRVTYANGGDETPEIIRVCKDDTASFFQQVQKLYSEFHLDLRKIEITYPVRRKEDGVEML